MPGHAIEAWAEIVETSNDFDIFDPTCCAMGHARRIGLLQKRRHPLHAALLPGCSCPQCCSYKGMARRTGIDEATLHAIFEVRRGRRCKTVARNIRKLIAA
jgi:hypothetical protein